MQVIFARNRHWISWLVRVRTNSDWSHVAIVDGDNVIEAMGGFGVTLTPIDRFKARYDKFEVRQMIGDIERARSKLGMEFDLSGLWGIFFRKQWQNPEQWFCSEIVAHACTYISDDYQHNFTPELLYWLSTPVTNMRADNE